jgi:GNAT superfamily N-acetyltransferase
MDHPGIWATLNPVFRAGETYAIDTDIGREEALAYWMAERAYVAEADGEVLGTYYMKRNQKGGGSHVCNCGYVTARAAQGRGMARAMLEHSLNAAKEAGFEAMQFNFVLASNARAIETWKRAGFDEVGRIPDAFRHPKLGHVDALIMYRKLEDMPDG